LDTVGYNDTEGRLEGDFEGELDGTAGQGKNGAAVGAPFFPCLLEVRRPCLLDFLLPLPFEEVGADEGLVLQEGMDDGCSLGIVLGVVLGIALSLGNTLGNTLGITLGFLLGITIGRALGSTLGITLGFLLGTTIGRALGSTLGISFGNALGNALGITFTIKVQIPIFPLLSVAVMVTLVFPRGNADPLEKSVDTVGLGSQSSNAEVEKFTTAVSSVWVSVVP
jgi:hypothetical protein